MQPMNVAIAGAGIAGLSVAALLARAGHHVTIYDKLPEPTPVGSGLIVQPVGQAVLQAMGLLDALGGRSAPLRRLNALNTRGQPVLDVHYNALGDACVGIGVHRAVLFEILLKAAENAGAVFKRNSEIVGVESAPGGRNRLTFRNADASPDCDVIVDALGVRSPLIARDDAFLNFGALWTNVSLPDDDAFPPDELTQRYRRADCSAGVMPIGEGKAAFFWTLRQNAYDAWRARGIDSWKREVLSLWPQAEPCLKEITDADQMIFARYAHHTHHAPVEGRLVHIGDAWHAASPQLGQGANMALLDAYALAAAIDRNGAIDDALAAFAKMRARHVKLYQAISWAFTPVYQSDSRILPALRDALTGPLSKTAPIRRLLAAIVSGRVGAPLKAMGL